MVRSCDETTLTIQAMMRQEASGYVCDDYLHHEQNNFLVQQQRAVAVPLHHGRLHECLNNREKMVDWCYQVVNLCDFDNESVAIAMNCFDRFVGTTQAGSQALDDPRFFQLAAMTSLYTAVKTNEPIAMDPKLLSQLSQGTYTEDQIEQMEFNILQALKWRVNPPTAIAFIRQFLDALLLIIPNNRNTNLEAMKETVLEVAKYQTELAIRDSRLVGKANNATVALAAFMNALESSIICCGLDKSSMEWIGNCLTMITNINIYTQHFVHVQSCLLDNVSQKSCVTMSSTTTYKNDEDVLMTDVPDAATAPAFKSYDTTLSESPRSLTQPV